MISNLPALYTKLEEVSVSSMLAQRGTATGPWVFMASKEPDNSASTVSAFAAQIGYVVMMIMALFFNPGPLDLLMGFGAVMLIALIIELGVAFTLTALENRSSSTGSWGSAE